MILTEVRSKPLTCGDCHFFMKGIDARHPEASVCRRHPKAVTFDMVPVPTDTRADAAAVEVVRKVARLPKAAAVQTQQQYNIAQIQGNPLESPDSPACGDFMDKRGRGYWVCFHERNAAAPLGVK
jgi:hypothetical protein